MKKKGLIIAFVALFTILAPYFIITFADLKLAKSDENEYLNGFSFSVYDETDDSLLELSALEYTKGALLCMSPEGSMTEALKAQAVVAFTQALREKLQNNGNEDIMGADFFVDSKNMYRYTTEEIARQKYGSKIDYIGEQIEEAIKSVLGEVMTVDSNVIAAPFHQISSGKTESAQNIWGAELSYLLPVDSSWDKQSYKYEVKTEFTREEINSAFKEIMGIEELLKEGEGFEILEKSDSQTVLRVKAGEWELTGNDIRKTLVLRSNAFAIEKTGEKYVFTTFGLGHGVGLSLYGSDYLARQGKPYVEILTHYFSGISIIKLK